MRPRGQLTDGGIMFSTCPFVFRSVRPSVCSSQTCERGILKMNEPILMQIGTSGEGMQCSTLGSGGQRPRSHGTEISNKIPFGEMSQELFNEFYPNLTGACYGKCPFVIQQLERKRSKFKVTRGQRQIWRLLAEASFSTSLDRVALLVYNMLRSLL